MHELRTRVFTSSNGLSADQKVEFEELDSELAPIDITKVLLDEIDELKEVIQELSISMSAIHDLTAHMKLAGMIYASKGQEIKITKQDVEGVG